MKDGKPDGYWKTYYENGVLKSEGNRKNFLLDSLWKFYNDSGRITLEIYYKQDKKNGLKRVYNDSGIVVIEENYVDDVKQGIARYYYEDDGILQETIPFINGKEEGRGFEFSKDSIIITITEYKQGAILKQERINRKDKQGLKQNIWKYFYPNGNVRLEGRYINDKKDGYFKYYATDGNLTKTEKYLQDSLIEMPEEITDLETYYDYYENARVKFKGTYRQATPEGVHRYYSMDGKVIGSKIYKNGVIVGEGIYDDYGLKQGYWKEYYDSGELKAEGTYKNYVKIGEWEYYHKNGKLEQTGKYINGKPDGEWLWYYESGNLLRKENFYAGIEQGYYTEYSDSGTVITEGNYIEGEKDGKWFYQMGDYREQGNYINGMRDGHWKAYYNHNNRVYFEGRFTNDQPDGVHTFYYDTGRVKEQGKYIFGKKEGEWVKYSEDGLTFLTIYYKDGVEKKYDGTTIKPPFEKP